MSLRLLRSRLHDITDQAACKHRALAEHATAMPHGDYQRAVDGLNRYRGLYLGKGRLAEAFFVELVPGKNLFRQVQSMCFGLLDALRKNR